MFRVLINSAPIVQQLGAKATEVLDTALDVLGEFAMSNIKAISSEKLSIQQQQEYMDSVVFTREQARFIIKITNPKYSALETGIQRFDIKPGLLQSPKAKRSKSGGNYIDVPFLHRTTKRGKGQYIQPKIMRHMVQKAVKAIAAGGPSPQRLFKHQPGMRRTKLSDMRVAYESAAGSQVLAARTFRRVSENSPVNSWIHPGTDGLGIFGEVKNLIEDTKDKVIADIMRERT